METLPSRIVKLSVRVKDEAQSREISMAYAEPCRACHHLAARFRVASEYPPIPARRLVGAPRQNGGYRAMARVACVIRVKTEVGAEDELVLSESMR